MTAPADFAAAKRAKRDAERAATVAAAAQAKDERQARTYTRAELRHDRWRTATLASVVAFAAGAAATSGLAWFWASWGQETASKRAVETFAQGVAVGQVVGEEPATDDAGVERPGKAPADAPR